MRRAAAALVALVALGLAGCADAPPAPLSAPTPTTLEGVYWRLDELAGEPQAAGVSLTFDGDRLRGEGPCNRYFGGYLVEDDMLAVGAVAATRRACPNLALEQRYLASLTEVQTYRIEHGALTLFDREGAPLMRFRG
jgi:heat shock protein HslJ